MSHKNFYGGKFCEPCVKQCDPCEKIDDCHIKKYPKNSKKCCCIKSDLTVEKNLLSVYTSPLLPIAPTARVISIASLTLVYEIILKNKSCCKIGNINIQDSLFGLFDNRSTAPFVNVSVRSCSDNLIPITEESILGNCGRLLDNCRSFVPPCTTSRLIVTVTLRPRITAQNLIVSKLLNSVIVTGCLESESHCGCCKKSDPIEPLSAKSQVYDSCECDVIYVLTTFV